VFVADEDAEGSQALVTRWEHFLVRVQRNSLVFGTVILRVILCVTSEADSRGADISEGTVRNQFYCVEVRCIDKA
jgi:hypothetical protein